MNILKITKRDLDKDNFYKKDCIGNYDNYENCHVEIEENLGWVKFKKGVYINGYLEAKAGSGIKAGWGIEAGFGIKAGEGIEAGFGIKAGWGIEAGFGIKAGWGIEAGSGIKAGWGIEAGEGIKAGWGIEAGSGIEAGFGIKAGLSITCKLSINIAYRIFAGLALWKKEVSDEEKTIICGMLENGKVEYGILKELGMPDENRKGKNGKNKIERRRNS